MGSRRISCPTVDVGECGIALRSPVPQLPGQFLRINFALGDESGETRWVDADGVVVRDELRERRHVLGIQFQCLDPATTNALRAYVRGHDSPTGLRPGITASRGATRVASRAAQMVEPPPPARVQKVQRPSNPTGTGATKPRPPADLLQRCLEMKKNR